MKNGSKKMYLNGDYVRKMFLLAMAVLSPTILSSENS